MIVVGFALLSKSSDFVIKRLLNISREFGFSEFAITFLVVGLASILPEFFIGITSAAQGSSTFGLGVILGSNVADLFLIVGLIAVAAGGINLHAYTLREMKWFMLPLALPILLILDGELSRFDGLVLVFAFSLYVFKLFLDKPPKHFVQRLLDKKFALKELLIILASLAVLLFACKLITDGANELSAALSLPLLFLGIVVAIGTCLPELAFAFKASRLRHAEMGLGNIFGNVLADAMLSVGVVALIQPITPKFPQMAMLSGAASIFAVLLILFLVRREFGRTRLTKNAGALLIFGYVIFILLQFFAEKLLVG